MPDQKSRVAESDDEHVSAKDDAAVRAIAEKFGVTTAATRDAIEQHGPLRVDVEAAVGKSKLRSADGDDQRWGRSDD